MADEKEKKDLSVCNGTSQNETEENGILELNDNIEEQKGMICGKFSVLRHTYK